jgi:hypothetical protein
MENPIETTPVNRGRRALISVCVIFFCLFYIAYLTLQKDIFPLGEITVKGMFSLVELVAMFYIGGSVIDASNIGGLLGKRAIPMDQAFKSETHIETTTTKKAG